MSREAVIRRIVKREMQKRGLTEELVQRDAPTLYRSACKYFGTWDTALKYAGVGVRRLYSKESYTREHVIQRLREYCKQGLKPKAAAVMGHDRRLYDAARRHFGTWKAAVSAADAVANTRQSTRRRRKWSQKLVLEQIQRRHQEGKPMNFNAVLKTQCLLLWAAQRYFGNWNAAVIAAGIAPTPRRRR